MNDFPPQICGTWIALDAVGRKAWLLQARDYHFAHGFTAAQARTAHRPITLDVAPIDDLTSFFCALGEAVNGPGGYFGLTLRALEDCLIGGFGAEAPWTLHVTDEGRLRRVLGSAELAAWAQQRSSSSDYLDDEGRIWLDEAVRRAAGGETLWADVRHLFEHCRVKVVDDAT